MSDALARLRGLITSRWLSLRHTPCLLQFPATLLLLAVIIGIGILTRNLSAHDHQDLIEHLGFDYADLRSGHAWQLLTGTWVQSDPGIEISMILMVASAAMTLEFLVGSIRAMGVMVVGDWISTILTSITLRLLSALGSDQATGLLTHADAGSSVLAHTGWAAAALILPRPIGPILYSLLLLVSISEFWWQGLAPALAHLFGVVVGGMITWRMRQGGHRSAAQA